MPRGARYTSLLLGVLIPLCAWGMVATLLLQLVELRVAFVGGGEWRLRQGVTAFALGVILIEKLRMQQGRSAAWAYGFFLAVAIAIFSAYHAWAYRIALAPVIVFLVNLALFAILWWAGAHIARACGSDAEAACTALDSGIVSAGAGASLDEGGPMRGRHPGRVIFYFSLAAVPVFGLGAVLFGPDMPVARAHLGALLVLYLLSAFLLLALSSLGQLASYFAAKEIAVPDAVGLSWIALAFVAVGIVVAGALALPQPDSPSRSVLQEQMVAIYRGKTSRHGVRDTARLPDGQDAPRKGGGAQTAASEEGGESGKASGGDEGAGGKGDSGAAKGGDKGGCEDSGKSGGGGSSENEGGTGGKQGVSGDEEREATERRQSGRQSTARRAATTISDAITTAMRLAVTFLVVAVAISLVVLALVMLRGPWSRLMHRLQSMRARRPARRRPQAPRPLEAFASIQDPFAYPTPGQTAGDVARVCWRGLMAYCTDRGQPCPPHATPFEFAASPPPCLEGFEPQSRRLAEMYASAEFSPRQVPEEALPELRALWDALKARARS